MNSVPDNYAFGINKVRKVDGFCVIDEQVRKQKKERPEYFAGPFQLGHMQRTYLPSYMCDIRRRLCVSLPSIFRRSMPMQALFG